MEKTKLFRTRSWYRPLFITVGDKDYELDDIKFFNENGVIVSIGSGFFEDDKEREFNGETIRKIKIDFSSKKNFIIKRSTNMWNNDIKYDLYVYEKNVDLQFMGKTKELYFGDIYSIWKMNDYTFHIFERTLKQKLNSLNDKAEEIIKNNFAKCFGYLKTGVDEKELEEKFNELREVNKQILEEVEFIQNYKVD